MNKRESGGMANVVKLDIMERDEYRRLKAEVARLRKENKRLQAKIDRRWVRRGKVKEGKTQIGAMNDR